MPSIEQLLQWRQEYEDIYQMKVLGQEFIIRPIGREEYKQLVFLELNLGEIQEAISLQCTIYPTNYNFSEGPAGVAEVIFDAILDASGLHLNQTAEILNAYREEMWNFDYQSDCLIHEAFPEYSIEEISGWSVRKTMFYLSRAEWVLENLKNIYLPHLHIEADTPPPGQPDTQQAQPQSPPRREIRKELVEGPDIQQPNQQKEPQSPPPQGGIQSEEELLAMLAGTGNAVTKPTTVFDEIKPELNWFSHMDELKGDFE